MILNIEVSKPIKVGTTEKGKFSVQSTITGELKQVQTSIHEVPCVQYNGLVNGSSHFSAVGKEADGAKVIADYIRSMRAKFKHSLHILKVSVADADWAYKLMDAAPEIFLECAVILYINVGVGAIESGAFDDSTFELLDKFNVECNKRGASMSDIVDRVVLIDNTRKMFTTDFNKLSRQLADYTGTGSIGVCNSPLSIGENACVTALRCREWAAKYVKSDFVVLPTANHVRKGGCNCIRYEQIHNDILTSSVKKPAAKRSGGGSATNGKLRAPSKTVRGIRMP